MRTCSEKKQQDLGFCSNRRERDKNTEVKPPRPLTLDQRRAVSPS